MENNLRDVLTRIINDAIEQRWNEIEEYVKPLVFKSAAEGVHSAGERYRSWSDNRYGWQDLISETARRSVEMAMRIHLDTTYAAEVSELGRIAAEREVQRRRKRLGRSQQNE